ncbi:glycosyltransferase [uncultured Paraglaciecola sp.]|uniref:glycosyltransferase n=1 Tax=uncultured Paraglaciecola sp. TaxID=1765024 RepID=UPI0030D97C5A|tara:strand:+ start:58449 stop:59678 length:1230 start_codon:yes stop_codon:yes gene_type:complete
MKLLIVTSNYPRWERDTTTPFVHNFARELVQQGIQVRVIAPHFVGAKTKEVVDGVEIRRFRYWLPLSGQSVCYQGGALGNLSKNPLNKLKLPVLVFSELMVTLKEILCWKPDVVNSHWLLPQGFVAALACKLTRSKHVATVHGGDVFALNSPLFRKLKKFAINNSTLVTVNSSVTEKVTKALAPGTQTPFLKLPTGILPLPVLDKTKITDLRTHLQKDSNEKLILFVGRLSEEKGVREAIQATAKLIDSGLTLRLIVIGEGHEKEDFKKVVCDLGINEYVDFLGWIENKDVYYYFSACDVFVGPSKTAANGQVEAQGLTFIEAMLAKCPVIGSNSGGIIDAVIPDKTGWLVEPGDAKDLAAKINSVLMPSVQKDYIVENAYQFSITNYLVAEVAKKFLLRTMLDSSAGK